MIFQEEGISYDELLLLQGPTRRWIERALWAGSQQIIARTIHFALRECGDDLDFINEQINKVKPRTLPWKWRDGVYAEFKRRQGMSRSKASPGSVHFHEPTAISVALAQIAAKDAGPEAEQRFKEIAARVLEGKEVILWGLGRLNRYRVIQGKSGLPEIVSDSNGTRRVLEARDLHLLQE
jgi:hypothetical protein